MPSRPRSTLLARALMPLVALAALAAPAAAQTTYIDPGGRFAIDLPEGWELRQNSPDVLFLFGSADLTSSVLVIVRPDAPDRAEQFTRQMETVAELGTLRPVGEGVVDRRLNGHLSRHGAFRLASEDGGRAELHVGAVELGPRTGLTYQATISLLERDSEGAAIREMLGSLRAPGRPVTGIAEARPVEVEIPGGGSDEGDAPAEADRDREGAAPAVPGIEGWETFEHELLRLRHPPDWELEEGGGAIVASLSHEEYGSIHVAATEGDGFGDSAEKILGTWRDATQGQVPGLEATGDPWEEETRSGDVLLLQELRGALVIDGEEVPHVFVLAADRSGDRGLGISTVHRASAEPDAREAILAILRTIR